MTTFEQFANIYLWILMIGLLLLVLSAIVTLRSRKP